MILSAPLTNQAPIGLPFAFSESKARELAKLLTLGVDTAEELGSYYDLNATQTKTLIASGYFRILLAEAQDELRNCNTVVEKTKAMARLASPEALTTLIRLARQGDDVRVSRDASETILNLAGLATKSPTAVPVGTSQAGIAISISFSAATVGQSPMLKDVLIHDNEQPSLQYAEPLPFE